MDPTKQSIIGIITEWSSHDLHGDYCALRCLVNLPKFRRWQCVDLTATFTSAGIFLFAQYHAVSEVGTLTVPSHMVIIATGPALMAERSTAQPLIARCLSPLSGFVSQSGHTRKLSVNWG